MPSHPDCPWTRSRLRPLAGRVPQAGRDTEPRFLHRRGQSREPRPPGRYLAGSSERAGSAGGHEARQRGPRAHRDSQGPLGLPPGTSSECTCPWVPNGLKQRVPRARRYARSLEAKQLENQPPQLTFLARSGCRNANGPGDLAPGRRDAHRAFPREREAELPAHCSPPIPSPACAQP